MKPLKILLGNNTLSLLAGSETWTKTLALELKKMGHSVKCFSSHLGIISDQLKNEDIGCYDRIETLGSVKPFSFKFQEEIKHEYDVIISSHHETVDFLRSAFPKTPIISMIHGVIHFVEDESGQQVKAPEHPATEAGVNQFLAPSEEVQEALKKNYNIDAVIIRNFFDLDKFQAKRKISKAPKCILFNSNYASSGDPQVEVIREVSKHYGAKVIAIGENFTFSIDVMQAIEDADIVVGMGRSVLEGVAAGRLGIVHGRWGTGGVIHKGNIQELASCNFSGRNSKGLFYTKEDFIREIDARYNQETIEWGVNYMKREHNVVHAANEIITIARSLLGQDINASKDTRRPYRRAKDIQHEN